MLAAPIFAGFGDCGGKDYGPDPIGYEPCIGNSMITGSHVGYGNYLDSTASSGDEVQCTYDDTDSASVIMDVLEYLGFGPEPKSVAIAVPNVSAGAKNPVAGAGHVSESDWHADYSGALLGTALSYYGTWDGYMSEVQADGSSADASTYTSGFYYEQSSSFSSAGGRDVYGVYGRVGDWTGEYELAAMPNQHSSVNGVRMFPILMTGDVGFGPVSTITVLNPGDGQTLMINGTAYTLTVGDSWSLINVDLHTPMHVVMDPAGTGETPRLRFDGNTPTDWVPPAHIGRAYSLPTVLAAAFSVYTGDQPWVLREYQAGLNLEAVGSGYSLGARFTDVDRNNFEMALGTGWTVRGSVTSRGSSDITVDITQVAGFPTNALTGTWTFTLLQ